MKKVVATLALAGLLVGGSAGLAAAQDDGGAAPSTESTKRAHRHRGARLAAKVAAETIGITSDELRTELQAGSTIAQVAEAHGVPADTVVNAIVEARTAKVRERAEKLVQRQFGQK